MTSDSESRVLYLNFQTKLLCMCVKVCTYIHSFESKFVNCTKVLTGF